MSETDTYIKFNFSWQGNNSFDNHLFTTIEKFHLLSFTVLRAVRITFIYLKSCVKLLFINTCNIEFWVKNFDNCLRLN